MERGKPPDGGRPDKHLMKLTTNLSEPLIELLAGRETPIDGIEVGPWINPQQIINHRESLPSFPFYFHGGEWVNRIGILPGSVAAINRYIKAAGSPWASMHITFLLPGVRPLFVGNGWRIPRLDPDRSTRRFVRKVQALRRSVDVCVLLENPDPMPLADNYEIQPDRITAILEATGCGLLLDTGHARLSSEALGIPAEEYILKLPLDRLRQIHVSGPRMREGRLFDAHEPLQETDYRLLDFVLARTKPDVVTLEYIRHKEELRQQLARLRRIVDDKKR